MDKQIKKAVNNVSRVSQKSEVVCGLPFDDSLVYTSTELVFNLVEELTDRSALLTWSIVARIEEGHSKDVGYSFTKQELCELTGLNPDKDHAKLNKIIKEVKATSVCVVNKDGDPVLVSLFDKIIGKRFSRSLDFYFHEDVSPFLFDIKSSTIRAYIKYFKEMSKYSQKLYLVLVSKFKTREVELEIAVLRKLFNCENKYQKTNDFKRLVIEKAVEGLKSSDINVTVKYNKAGGIIESCYFEYDEAYPDQSPRLKPVLNVSPVNQNLSLKEFVEIEMNFDEEQAIKLIELYSECEIKGAFEIGMTRIRNKNNKRSRGGFFVKSIDSLVDEFNCKKSAPNTKGNMKQNESNKTKVDFTAYLAELKADEIKHKEMMDEFIGSSTVNATLFNIQCGSNYKNPVFAGAFENWLSRKINN